MPEDKETKEGSVGLRCVSCGYELTGLAVDSSCPECGFSIARSKLLASEQRRAGRELPRIGLATLLVFCSTITGIPGIIVYAIPFSAISGVDALSEIPRWASWGFQFLLLLAGWLPVLTLSSVPRRLHRSGGIGRTVAWGFAGLVGIGLMNTGSLTLLIIGSALGVTSGVLNLTRANRTLGLVIPAWHRLGEARQRRGPLVGAVILIAVGRLVLSQIPITAPGQEQALLVWISFMTLGTQILLVVGGVYLLINRLWLIWRLWRSMRLRERRGA